MSITPPYIALTVVWAWVDKCGPYIYIIIVQVALGAYKMYYPSINHMYDAIEAHSCAKLIHEFLMSK